MFASYTQHAWEDYWITFRASRNLATGHGLVFTVGERLHTFTSPLGVLLPAAFSWLTGNQSDDLPLWMFRLVSIAALAAGTVLLYRAVRPLQQYRLSTFLTIALVAFDAKTVDFGTNGMETGLLFFFLALTIHGLLVAGPRRIISLGIGWAGLMWTRPDSCVYIAVLGLAALMFPPGAPGEQSRAGWWRIIFGAAAVCTVVYLPWFVWSWSYYGSPVPNTVIAKATNQPALSAFGLLGDLLLFPLRLLARDTSMRWTFLPAYASFGGWPEAARGVTTALGLVAALAWLIPLFRPQTRLFSLAYFLGNYFLSVVVRQYYPWYLPSVAVLGYLAIGLLFDQVLGLASHLPQLGWARGWFARLPAVLVAVAVLLAGGQVALTMAVARQMQLQQTLIENGLRHPIGLWLRQHAHSPQDTVLLEPLGYISYFSGLKMLDYPGLSSRAVVDVRRRLGPDKENLAFVELKPDWMVLRPAEIQAAYIVEPRRLDELYQLVQAFDAKDRVKAIRWLPGRPYLEFDQTFLVFHRKAGASTKAADIAGETSNH